MLLKKKAIPPIAAPGGKHKGKNGGVKAHIYQCGECTGNFDGMTAAEVEEAGGFIAYLSTYSSKAKKVMESGDVNKIMSMQMSGMTGVVIKSVKGKKWVPENSGPGYSIVKNISENCSGEIARMCRP